MGGGGLWAQTAFSVRRLDDTTFKVWPVLKSEGRAFRVTATTYTEAHQLAAAKLEERRNNG